MKESLDRRAFLAAGAAFALAVRSHGAQPVGFPGLIVRESEPPNLEFPFSSLKTFLIPNERFYVRNHFAIPKVDERSWRLKVEGHVNRPLELTAEAIRRLPAQTRPILLECAGNGRVYLTPKARGVAWQLGAVGTANWTGVPLAAVLERVGVKSGAVEVVLEGADTGEIKEDPKSPGAIPFARSLPLTKAQSGDVLLAYQMNGAPLPPAHGGPLRAVVAGWYGMASVKWLKRVLVVDRPFQGFFQTLDYTHFERTHGLATLVPITELEVKAQIARPSPYEVVPAHDKYSVFGAAWSGDADVTKVEVSTDGGNTWLPTRLLDKPVRHAWRLWEYDWRTPKHAGRQRLMARASDSRGRTQPMQRDPDRRTYMISHVLPVEVEVR
jgi:DMSO/TMAO reductase YedYZ molybdopterin-dependent catalytic subunit